MKQMRWMIFCLALALWAGCGDDSTGGGEPVTPVPINGALVIPAEWAGTWTITMSFRDCVTDVVHSQEVITAQVCPGDTLVNPFAPIFEDCDGTITGNHLSASCEYSASEGACQVSMDLDFTMDVSGNSLSGLGTIQTTATPECGSLFVAGCEEVVITGLRLSTSTLGCDTLVTTTSARNPFLR